MDVQLKRGFLEVCVLKVLSRGDSYGYQLIKDISPCIDISESTLYPILKRLESSDMVAVYSVEHNSRLRKYYRITEAGRKKIEDFIDEWKEVIAVYRFITSGEDSEGHE
jgi:PadR family transcriptional regulator PadR